MRLGRSADGNDNGAVRQNQGKYAYQSLTLGAASGAMIGVARKDGRRAVDLLGKNDSRESVRQGHRTERDKPRRLGQHIFAEAVGAADHKGHAVSALVAKLRQQPGEGLARQCLAAGIETDREMR